MNEGLRATRRHPPGWRWLAVMGAVLLGCADEHESATAALGPQEQASSLHVGALKAGQAGASSGTSWGVGAAQPRWQASPLVQGESARLVAADPASLARLGAALSLDGSLALVGAPGDSDAGLRAGAAYVYQRTASSWVEQAKLVASDAASEMWFGTSVSISAEVALVGAPQFSRGLTPAGAAYVFARSASSWAEQVKLVADVPSDSDAFGHAVALEGNVALVAAPRQTLATVGLRAAYVFTRSAGQWPLQATLKPIVLPSEQDFGQAVALAGERALVGTAKDAYVFRRSALAWGEEATLRPSAATALANASPSVSLAQDVALVGASQDSEFGFESGAVHVFTRSASTWSAQPKLLPADLNGGTHFGSSVSLDGRRVLVGAPAATQGAAWSAGAAYVFARNATGWLQTATLRATSPQAGASLGAATSLDGEWAVAGVPFGDEGGNRLGAAYVFRVRALGASCDDAAQCAGGRCVDGHCCDSECAGSCQQCDLVGKLGYCSIRPHGELGAPSCGALLCDGVISACPSSCSGDVDCVATHWCSGGVCEAKRALGSACTDLRPCLSGHCVDGLCCSAACLQSCERCDMPGSVGDCLPRPAGDPGNAVCGAYVCDGDNASCPAGCTAHGDCAEGYHCAQSECVPLLRGGEACTNGAMCRSDTCTDGLCCLAASCAPYRCGTAGACATSCVSSNECAEDYECSSRSKCVQRSASPVDEAGGCTVSSRRAPRPSSMPVWCFLGAAVIMRRARARWRGRP